MDGGRSCPNTEVGDVTQIGGAACVIGRGAGQTGAVARAQGLRQYS